MPENIKALRRRIRSIRNTKQITRAMEMVSAAKLRRAEELLKAGRPYASKLQEVLGRLASSPAAADHPLAAIRPVKRKLLIVVTADRGLAGAFNNVILKHAESVLATGNYVIFAVGRKAADYFRARKAFEVIGSFTDISGKLSADRSNEIANKAMDLFLNGEVDEVELLYNRFVNMLSYKQNHDRVLPLTSEALLGSSAEAESSEYILEPSAAGVLESLLPRFVRSKVYISLAESQTAELSSRMIAMSNATKNCQELIDNLTLVMNKARQAGITTEIIEVVSGAQSLAG